MSTGTAPKSGWEGWSEKFAQRYIPKLADPPVSKLHPREQVMPVTLAGKMRQFPWRFYWRHSAVFRCGFYAWCCVGYVMWKLQWTVREPHFYNKWKGVADKDLAQVWIDHNAHFQKHEDHHFGEHHLQHLKQKRFI